MNKLHIKVISLISMSILFLGCAKYQTYSIMDQTSQTPSIDQIVNQNGSLTLQMKGERYYGNLLFDSSKHFELSPLIESISGNAKGTLVDSNGHVITCVMELQEETKSGSGYCLEDDNPKLLKIYLVTIKQ